MPKKKKKRRERRGGVRRPRVARAPSPPRESDERRLLAIARELSALTGLAPADAVRAALTRLAPATTPARAGDKGATLALAWAREQARLALTEVLERGATAGVVRRDVPPPTLAWLVLAACEAVAHETYDAAPDRLQALASFIGVPGD